MASTKMATLAKMNNFCIMKFSLKCQGLTSGQSKDERLRRDLRSNSGTSEKILLDVRLGEGNNFCTFSSKCEGSKGNVTTAQKSTQDSVPPFHLV
jgi:hypothetical protein